jgi:hypothetical protein
VGDIAGWVLLGIGVIVFAYILPTAIRSRQVVVDSRVDDRYSDDLRIVATAGRRQASAPTTGRVFVHPVRANEEVPMSSPADRQLAAADARRLAAARAARAAASSRRAAAARRRLVLTGLLLVVAAGLWAGFALLTWPLVAPIVATVALAGVVLLGRRAATAGNAADARWERELAAITAQARQRASSSARKSGKPQLRVDVDPTTLVTEPARVVEPEGAPAEPQEGAWTPVPVPPPAYTLKQSAPRREVSPLVMGAATEVIEPVATGGGEGSPVVEAAQTRTPVEPAIDVQAVLARRRAAG